jgi:hypothetical protein
MPCYTMMVITRPPRAIWPQKDMGSDDTTLKAIRDQVTQPIQKRKKHHA